MTARVSSRVDQRQVGILADRYLDVMLGDLGGTVLLLLQAPLLAAGIAGVWVNISQDSLTLYFVLALSAFFLGTVNASREIVKERALYLRERMFNLSAGAYLVSKYRVQAILVVLQASILAGLVEAFVSLEVNLVALALVLILTALAGTAVGLLVSSLTNSSDGAVGLVPVVVIPQILFSDTVIGEDRLENWTGWLQDLMPVHWAYEILGELRGNETDYGQVTGGVVVLCVTIAVCFGLSLFRLSRLRY